MIENDLAQSLADHIPTNAPTDLKSAQMKIPITEWICTPRCFLLSHEQLFESYRPFTDSIQISSTQNDQVLFTCIDTNNHKLRLLSRISNKSSSLRS
jgi:hypothetical protein